MRINSRHAWSRTFTCALLLSLSAASSLQAQSVKDKPVRGEPVLVVAAPDSLVPVATTMIVRDHRKGRFNVVLLRQSSATSLDLERAMQSFVFAHLGQGNRGGKAMVATLKATGGTSTDPATRALFASLRSAPVRNIAGVGRVPAVVVSLPTDEKLKEKFKSHLTKKS